MADDHFLPSQEIERFLSFKPRELQEIALELRSLVARHAPAATERVLWKGLSYHDAAKGGPVRGNICQIELHADHVRLSFVHGAFLEDPDRLLQGDRLAKRYVVLKSYEQAPWAELAGMIRRAASFDAASTTR